MNAAVAMCFSMGWFKCNRCYSEGDGSNNSAFKYFMKFFTFSDIIKIMFSLKRKDGLSTTIGTISHSCVDNFK